MVRYFIVSLLHRQLPIFHYSLPVTNQIMTSTQPQSLKISLPTGSLGVGIFKGTNGQCVVSSKSNVNSPLEVNDIILSLNGIVSRVLSLLLLVHFDVHKLTLIASHYSVVW